MGPSDHILFHKKSWYTYHKNHFNRKVLFKYAPWECSSSYIQSTLSRIPATTCTSLYKDSGLHIFFVSLHIWFPNDILVPCVDLCSKQVPDSYLYHILISEELWGAEKIIAKMIPNSLRQKKLCHSNCMFLVYTDSIIFGENEFSKHPSKLSDDKEWWKGKTNLTLTTKLLPLLMRCSPTFTQFSHWWLQI